MLIRCMLSGIGVPDAYYDILVSYVTQGMRCNDIVCVRVAQARSGSYGLCVHICARLCKHRRTHTMNNS
jgi:hypothetical protein